MQNNKNTEVFIHLSREQSRLRKESHQYFLQLKEMFNIAISQLSDSEAQLDFIDRERVHIDYFFADPPHPDHLHCLRKSMTYDEKTWKMLEEICKIKNLTPDQLIKQGIEKVVEKEYLDII